MSKIKTFLRLLKNDRRAIGPAIFLNLKDKSFMRLLSDRIYLRFAYRCCVGKSLDLKEPTTFSQKLQWLKLYDRRPEYTLMVDKYAVKEYVSSKIGNEYIIPTIAIWENVDDIDFEMLPNKFALKWNHDSGSVVICKDKSNLDIKQALRKLSRGSIMNGYWFGREWPYKNVKPCVIAEELLEDPDGLCDYKFFCFNGKVKCFKVDFDRFTNHRANYYDEEGNLLQIGEAICPPDFRDFTMPTNLNNMIELAETLAEEFPFVRVDFYNCKGKIYFGEITFYPASGFGVFTTDEADVLLGSWLKLPQSLKCKY